MKLKQHANKLYIILAFISGGGLGQISDFIFDVREAFSSEVKKPKATQLVEEQKVKYIDKDFKLQKAETYK